MAIKPISKSSIFLSYTDPNLVELSVAGFDGEIQANHLTYSVNGNLSGEVVYAGLGTKRRARENRRCWEDCPYTKRQPHFCRKKY
ncbi:hypothetical protein RCO48_02910 [Peribacillus frigoritolerans]|nr:hypothetical protein [Peribacillus frigoritolerans]